MGERERQTGAVAGQCAGVGEIFEPTIGKWLAAAARQPDRGVGGCVCRWRCSTRPPSLAVQLRRALREHVDYGRWCRLPSWCLRCCSPRRRRKPPRKHRFCSSAFHDDHTLMSFFRQTKAPWWDTWVPVNGQCRASARCCAQRHHQHRLAGNDRHPAAICGCVFVFNRHGSATKNACWKVTALTEPARFQLGLKAETIDSRVLAETACKPVDIGALPEKAVFRIAANSALNSGRSGQISRFEIMAAWYHSHIDVYGFHRVNVGSMAAVAAIAVRES